MKEKIDWCQILQEAKVSNNLDILFSLIHNASSALFPISFYKFPKEFQEEVIQDAITSLWQSLPRFDENLGCHSWVKTICHSRYIDHLRKEKKLFVTRSIEDDEYIEEVNSSIHRIEIQHDIKIMLENLTQEETTLFLELKIFGNSLKELAQKFNKSEGSLKVRISRILNKLISKK